MDSIRDLAPEIQQRISVYKQAMRESGMRLPVVKNTTALLWAMLKERSVQVTVLARALEEEIAPKKTWERLRRTVGKEELRHDLLEVHREKNAEHMRRMKYCVVDPSDIRKVCARKMEGLSLVRDGSTKEIGNGYWWLNLTMADSTGMLPVYTELYSLDYEGKAQESENKKMLHAIGWVQEVHSQAIFVIDRGGDRGVLFETFFRNETRFIVRGQGTRDVGLHKDSTRKTNIMEVAIGVPTNRRYQSRTGVGFRVGCKRIYMEGQALWLVVTRREENPNAVSWFLTNVEGSGKKVMDTVMEGYGYRWRVEEYHRQVKQDYSLESMCLREYEALKNLTVLVMMAAAFVMRLSKMLVLKLVAAAHRLPRNKLSDIPSYEYYMLSAAVSWVLNSCRKLPPKSLLLRKRDYFQLSLHL